MKTPDKLYVDRKGTAFEYRTALPGHLEHLARQERSRRAWRVIAWFVIGAAFAILAAAVFRLARN